MIRLRDYPQEDVDRYYKRLREHLEMTSFWRNLQGKAEAGTTRSEKGYQMIASSMAERIARDLGYHVDKAVVLCVCVGSCFPRHGEEGRRVIRQYIEENALGLDFATLPIETIEDYICNRLFVATDLDQALRAYYLGETSQAAPIPEVELVKVCQDAVVKVKQAERFLNADGGELLLRTVQEIEQNSKQAGRPVQSANLDEMVRSLPVRAEDRMSPEERADMLMSISGYVRSFGKEGVYKFISTD